jgi:Putative Flp pilus-assembly TadE/G-like
MPSRSFLTRRREAGQASLLLLGVVTLLLGLAVVLFAFGSALGSKGKYQRAADLAAVSGGQVMRELYPRLFEPPVLANGLPNPRHLPLPVYLALVRRAALRGARRNGVEARGADVSFPGGGFAPTRVGVRVRGVARVRVKQSGGGRGEPIPVTARAVAEIAPDLDVPTGCHQPTNLPAARCSWPGSIRDLRDAACRAKRERGFPAEGRSAARLAPGYSEEPEEL